MDHKPYRVVGVWVDRYRYRWFGMLEVEGEAGRLRLPMTGAVARWFRPGETVLLALRPEADPQALTFEAYALWRPGEAVPVWPLFQETFVLERGSPLSPTPLYRYTVRAREAGLESDYEAIVDLEQHHYASEAEVLARWWCPEDRTWAEANVRPLCPRCQRPMRFDDLKDATRASRFLVLTLAERMPYEPLYIGYVRIDPPIPLMHRRLPDGTVQPNLRQTSSRPSASSPPSGRSATRRTCSGSGRGSPPSTSGGSPRRWPWACATPGPPAWPGWWCTRTTGRTVWGGWRCRRPWPGSASGGSQRCAGPRPSSRRWRRWPVTIRSWSGRGSVTSVRPPPAAPC